MRIVSVEPRYADGGWRTFAFVKVVTDVGPVGWSEFTENYGSPGLGQVISQLGRRVVGEDPRDVRRLTWFLGALTRQAPGGTNQQAVAAISNALLDIAAKALDVPVSVMLGGGARDKLPVYWSHGGSYRLSHSELIGVPPVGSLDDLVEFGRVVRASGIGAVKCNIMAFDGGLPRMHMPGFPATAWPIGENTARFATAALVDSITALRSGLGPDVDIMVDLNFNFHVDGYRDVVRELGRLDVAWVELDVMEPRALADIRSRSAMTIASGESLFGRQQYLPFLTERAMDVVIIDVIWNGLLESLAIASMAAVHELTVAPHNFYGHLSSLISAQFCMLVENFRVMEVDIDDVPWKDDLVTAAPRVVDGLFIMPDGPGWGADVNEEALEEHPPRIEGELDADAAGGNSGVATL